jgi:hypothetical protein
MEDKWQAAFLGIDRAIRDLGITSYGFALLRDPGRRPE